MVGRGARDPKVDERAGPRERTRGLPETERRVAAWIGASIVIEGQVTSSEDITIAGRVKGDVEASDYVVIITDGAHIDGRVVALDVVVHGRVDGNIEAKRRVEIGATGFLAGDVVAPRMTVSEGATLNGRLRIAPS